MAYRDLEAFDTASADGSASWQDHFRRAHDADTALLEADYHSMAGLPGIDPELRDLYSEARETAEGRFLDGEGV